MIIILMAKYSRYSLSFSLFQDIPSVTRKHQHFVVKCEAQNEVGLSAATETLNVICMCAVHVLFFLFSFFLFHFTHSFRIMH